MSYRQNQKVVYYVKKTEEPSKDSPVTTTNSNADQKRIADRQPKVNQEEVKRNYKDTSSHRNGKSKDETSLKKNKIDSLDTNTNNQNGTKDSKYEEENKSQKMQRASRDETNFQQDNSKKEVKDPFTKALLKVMEVIPIRFRKPTDQLYTKLKTRSQNNDQVLFMLVWELFDPYILYELQCMIAMYCHMLLDSKYDLAHSYYIEFKNRLSPKLAGKFEYLPAFLDFVKTYPKKAKLLNFPPDNFFPEKGYLRITDLQYTPQNVFWVSFDDQDKFPNQMKLEKAIKALKGNTFGIDGEWRSYGPPKLALLQFATADQIFLFDMLSIQKADAKGIEEFVSLFRDANTTKIFFGSGEDVNQICNFVNGISKKGVSPIKSEEVKSVVDLQLSLSEIYDLPDRSLKSLAKFLFEKELCKLNQCSNWNNRPLRESQRHYAALDAAVTYKVYEYTLKKGHSIKIWKEMKEIEVLLEAIREEKRIAREARLKEKEEKRLQELKQRGMDIEYEQENDTKFGSAKQEDSPILDINKA